MAIHLEPAQEKLFEALRDAVQSVPRREDREEFMLLRTFGGDSVQGNGLEQDVLFEDIMVLDDAGLIKVTGHHRRGTGLNFVIPPSAIARFDEYKAGSSGSGEVAEKPRAAEPARPARGANPKAVMVVHGRNREARDAMFAFLRRLGLTPLDWDDLVAGTGKAAPYVGEILDHAFTAAKAVVVLFTPDDEARLRDEFHHGEDEAYETDLTPQARPNVLFEAGMALASYPTSTVLVELGRLRPFSDLYGRHVVRLNGTKERLRDIAKRLQTAECDVEPADDVWDDPTQFPAVETISSAPRRVSPQPTPSTISREVGYLNEDARRWIADRNEQLIAESQQRSGEMNAAGVQYSSAHLVDLMMLRKQALQEYRDEMSGKRRQYAALLDQVPGGAEVPRFELDHASRKVLAGWRTPVTVPGSSDELAVDDPTDPSREPDLRQFEEHGDGPR